MDITITMLSNNGKRISVVVENAGSFNYKSHLKEIAIKLRKKTRIAEGKELIAFLNMSKDEDCIYLPHVEEIEVITFEDTTYAEPVPDADPETGEARIPTQNPDHAIRSESIKESEVEKASDSDIDKGYESYEEYENQDNMPDYILYGFKSQKEFDDYMEEGQRIADEFDSIEEKEMDGIRKILNKFLVGGKIGDEFYNIKRLIEDTTLALNQLHGDSERKYWEDSVELILKQTSWKDACSFIKNYNPNLYLRLVYPACYK